MYICNTNHYPLHKAKGQGGRRRIEAGDPYAQVNEWSAAMGEVYSQYNLALVLRGVNEGPVDEERSTYWLKQAAGRGFGPAQVDLSISYLEGIGVELDLAAAYQWALSSVASGEGRGEKRQAYCEDNIQEDDLKAGRLRAASFRQSI